MLAQRHDPGYGVQSLPYPVTSQVSLRSSPVSMQSGSRTGGTHVSHLLRPACRGMHRRRSSRILGAGTRSQSERSSWQRWRSRHAATGVGLDLVSRVGQPRISGSVAVCDDGQWRFRPVEWGSDLGGIFRQRRHGLRSCARSFDLGRPVGVGSPAERPVSAHHHWEVTARVWR